MDRSTRQSFGVGLTRVTASHGDLHHIISDGSNGEWRIQCSRKWIPHGELLDFNSDGTAIPTCLACIVGDAAWWAGVRRSTKNVTFGTF